VDQNRRVDEMVVTDDGCRLWTTRSGTGDPLVLCHGGPGFWDTFAGLAGLLGDTATAHRWDQRGCGRSEWRGPYTLARSLADLRPRWAVDSLERALPDVRRVVLPGAGHLPWVEAPAAFRSAVTGFLAEGS
jgi:pimeloyl-ACP methyl ester carboxylesterase